MERFRTILVSVTGHSSQQPLVDRAARLAQQNQGTVTLTAVVEDLPWYTRLVLPSAEDSNRALVREKSEALEGLAGPLRQGGVEVATKVLRGRPALEIVREVLRGRYDLVMKEAEPNQDVLFGPADMQLLRDCPSAVWLLNPAQGDRPFTQILAAVDPAPAPDVTDLLHLNEELAPKDAALDLKILNLADSLSETEGAALHILHAWSAHGEVMLRSEGRLAKEQVDAYVNDSKEAARKALDQLVARLPAEHGRRVTHLVKGDPAEAIAELVKTGHIDLIVMGTVARTGIPGLLIGNTAETILQRVNCSVLTVKPDRFVSPVPSTE